MIDRDKLYNKYLTDKQIAGINNGTLSTSEKQEILQKYNNILRIITTYLPQNIVKAKINNYNSTIHDGRFVEGTLLFLDVNGFTALTEQLNKHGNQGSEEITRILNNFFTEMVNIILKFKGSLLKYGGDAMMVYFSSESDFCGEQHAYHALSCAFEMKDKISEIGKVESRFGTFQLSVSIAVHSDMFYETSVGDPEIHIEYFLTGKGVETTADMEGFAGKNEILICENTYFRLREYITETEKRDKYLLVKNINGLKLPPATGAIVNIDFDDIYELLITLDAIKSYLIQGIYEKVQSNWQKLNLEGEYRIVSVIFLNYYFSKDIFSELGIGKEEEIHSILKEYFTVIQDTVNSFDGVINKVDMYQKGDKIIVIFGFPRSHFDDEERAIKCAHQIIDSTKKFKDITFSGSNFSIIQKIGIHNGFIYAGNVGSPLRKEYTIMGDTVNLSARIMSGSGEDEIWMSDVIYKKAQGISLVKKTEERKFKGKTGLITVHQLGGIAKETAVSNEIFIGREREKDSLLSLFQKINEEPAAIQILGSVGVGKTALLREFLKNLTARHEILIGRGIPYGKNIQYNAIKEILIHYFGITGRDDEAKIENKINTYLKFLKLEDLNYTIPLIGAILSDGFKNSAIMEIEDPIAKKEIIFRSGKRLLSVLSDLLEISVIEAGKFNIEYLDFMVSDVINDITILLKAEMDKKNIKLITNYNSINTIRSDPSRVRQILLNLIGNAIKFTENGTISIDIFKNENNYEFHVKDSGIGIEDKNISVIFDMFRQVENPNQRKYQGTGLGLAICKKLVEAIGGKIWVKSEFGSGSDFAFSIPVIATPNVLKYSEKIEAGQEETNANNLRIFFAEDEETNFELVKDLLSSFDKTEVQGFRSGKEILTKLKSDKLPDIIFLDIEMPVMSGLECLKEIKKIDENIPVVALTAYAMKSDREKFINEGFNDFIAKPIDKLELMSIINKYKLRN